MVTSDSLQACHCFQSLQLVYQGRFPFKFPKNHFYILRLLKQNYAMNSVQLSPTNSISASRN